MAGSIERFSLHCTPIHKQSQRQRQRQQRRRSIRSLLQKTRLQIPPQIHQFLVPHHPILLQIIALFRLAAVEPPRLLDASGRRAHQNRRDFRPPEPSNGVARLQVVEGRSPAAEGGDGVFAVGEAVQARPRRREAEPPEGSGLVLERGGAWLDACYG